MYVHAYVAVANACDIMMLMFHFYITNETTIFRMAGKCTLPLYVEMYEMIE